MSLPIFRYFNQPRIKELIRCQVPSTLPIERKQRLLEGIVNLQMAFIDEQHKVFIELIYRNEVWSFELNDTHAISFHAECLWIPDNELKTIMPFNLHYISEVNCTMITE